MEIINILVTLSNIFGLIPLVKSFQNENYLETIFIFLIVLASCLMHISERKHGLPGYALIRYSNEMLWFDRITAILAGTYGLYKVIINPNLVLSCILMKLGFGIMSLYISEILCGTDQIPFAFFHSVWHALAYWALADVL